MDSAIYLFRNDLRINNNPLLYRCLKENDSIIPLFIIDEKYFTNNQLGFSRMSSVKFSYLQHSLAELKKKLDDNLIIIKGDTVKTILEISTLFNIKKIYTTKGFTFEEIQEEIKLSEKRILINEYNSIFQPENLPFDPEISPYYYTHFKNKTFHLQTDFKKIIIDKSSNGMVGNRVYNTFSPFNLNTTIKPHYAFGENAAQTHLLQFINKNIQNYSSQREYFQGHTCTSELSPFLAVGALSYKQLYHTINQILDSNPNNESIIKFKEQLLWSEYFKYLFIRYKTKLFTHKGLRQNIPSMYDDKESFNAWKNGKTGNRLIDAIMNELRHTGFIKNRPRMITASYLTKDLKVNWLWGAQWFEYCLIDYDVCNNYGNWSYIAGTGTNSRINRRLSPERQLKKYDPKEKYIATWLTRE